MCGQLACGLSCFPENVKTLKTAHSPITTIIGCEECGDMNLESVNLAFRFGDNSVLNAMPFGERKRSVDNL